MINSTGLALENLAMDFRQDKENSNFKSLWSGSDENSMNGRRLEYCDDGFWLITPRGGGFPFYGVSRSKQQNSCCSNRNDFVGTIVDFFVIYFLSPRRFSRVINQIAARDVLFYLLFICPRYVYVQLCF